MYPGGYPSGMGNPPYGSQYTSQGGYPPQQGGYPSQVSGYPSGLPPYASTVPYQSAQGYPSQMPPYISQQGGYPPYSGSSYPGQQGGYQEFPGQQLNYQNQPQQGQRANAYMSQSFQPSEQQLQGWGASYYQQLQPHEIAEMKGWFAAVDKDRSGTITASELTTMTFAGKKLTLVTARMLLNVFDTDRSGDLGFFEYCALHKFVTSMQAAFYKYDADRSGKLDINEVSSALGQGGFQFSLRTIQQLFTRFEKKQPGQKQSGLDFESFLQMCAYLGQVKSTFTMRDSDRDGWVKVNLEELVQMSGSMPSTSGQRQQR